PAMLLPALQANAGHPAAALANRGAEGPWKILAGSHRSAGRQVERHENLAVAQSVQTKSGFVILGVAFWVEHAPVAGACQPFQRRAVKAGAHSVGGQESAQPLADGNV